MSKFEGKTLFCIVKRRTLAVVGGKGVVGQVGIFQDLKDDYNWPILFTSRRFHLSFVPFLLDFEDSCQLNVKSSLKEHQCWTIDHKWATSSYCIWFCQIFQIPFVNLWNFTHLTVYVSAKVFFCRLNKFYRNESLLLPHCRWTHTSVLSSAVSNLFTIIKNAVRSCFS